MPTTEIPESSQRINVHAAGRTWLLERPADLESLWQSMDEDDPKAEEHIPYWVELWPATLALCGWLARQELRGRRCLDIGCGLGCPPCRPPALARRWWAWTSSVTPCALQPETPA